MLAIVLEAVFRIGNRVRLETTHGCGRDRGGGFVGYFLFRCCISRHRLRRGADRFHRRRELALPGVPRTGSSTRRPVRRERGATNSLLGEKLPEHAKPTVALAPSAGIRHLARTVARTSDRRSLFRPWEPPTCSGQIAIFFSKMAMVTFGGAYAVLAYVAQQAVENYGWLKPGEMLDGLGMAETTPGPLIMVLQFVGFMAAYRDPGALSPMLAGTMGGLLATWVTFTPCFLWIFLSAPFVETLRGNKALAGALSAITAAVCGVILNLAIWLAIHTFFREVTPRTAATACRSTCRCSRGANIWGAHPLRRRRPGDLLPQDRDDLDARRGLHRGNCSLRRGSAAMTFKGWQHPANQYRNRGLRGLGWRPTRTRQNNSLNRLFPAEVLPRIP